MSRNSNQFQLWIASSLMVTISVVAWAGQRAGLLTGLRMTLHNVVSPGRLIVLAMTRSESSNRTRPLIVHQNQDLSELQNALLQNELQRRQLLIQNARLQHQLEDNNQLKAIRSVAGYDLVNFVAIRAKVLSHAGLPGVLKEAFIDAGKTSGLKVNQLVVDGGGILLDKGSDHGLTAGQKVAHGTAVIGRIDQISQWVGLVQPITDSEYSGAAQIVKLKQHGASFGARGILQGNGEGLCIVTGIPYTESVAVGDLVFTASVQGVNGPQLYYGRVIHAEFSEAGQWEVHVQPAFDPTQLAEVSVVQQRLAPRRVTPTQRSMDGGSR